MKLELEKLEAALEEERDQENGSGARQEEEEKQWLGKQGKLYRQTKTEPEYFVDLSPINEIGVITQ